VHITTTCIQQDKRRIQRNIESIALLIYPKEQHLIYQKT